MTDEDGEGSGEKRSVAKQCLLAVSRIFNALEECDPVTKEHKPKTKEDAAKQWIEQAQEKKKLQEEEAKMSDMERSNAQEIRKVLAQEEEDEKNKAILKKRAARATRAHRVAIRAVVPLVESEREHEQIRGLLALEAMVRV